MPLPQSETKYLTETDLQIIRALSKDSRKATTLVARELGLSTKTVRKRVDRLRRENTIFTFPIISIESMPGLIPIYFSYAYASSEAKASVDRTILSHFDTRFLTGSFSDPETGSAVLSASTMSDVQKFLDWAKSQRGIASARVDIPIETLMFPEKLIELLEVRDDGAKRLQIFQNKIGGGVYR
jgi:DNA-binding Lrp family transcriptional regulator